MARLDVHARRDGDLDHLLNLQADLRSGLTTKPVVPLLPEAQVPAPAAHLNPLVDIVSERNVVITQFAMAIHARTGGASCDACRRHETITAVLDLLITSV